MLNYYSKFKLLSPYLIISLISILLVFDKNLAEKISVLLIFVISTIFLKNFYFIVFVANSFSFYSGFKYT